MDDKFGYVYDKMNNNYSRVMAMLGDLYEEIRHNPNDERGMLVLEGLGEVALGILSEQRDFTDIYCNDEIKDRLIDNIQSKIDDLSQSLLQIKGSRGR